MYDFIVIGGGASGMFAAIAAKQANPHARVIILEKTERLLSKVRVSGGGRCNVTNACFDLPSLIGNYPRGGKELIGPFHRFQPQDTIAWFTARGVILKTENEGRVFPVTDSSETIIQCLISQAEKQGVEIALSQQVQTISTHRSLDHDHFEIAIKGQAPLLCRSLLIATGSSPEGYSWAKMLGHTIIPPVPSLFSFTVPSSPFRPLSGISVDPVEVQIVEAFAKASTSTPLLQRGPLLITHQGFSGPCILKLSSLGAPLLHEKNYHAEISINWLPRVPLDDLYHQLVALKKQRPQKTLVSENPFGYRTNSMMIGIGSRGSLRIKKNSSHVGALA